MAPADMRVLVLGEALVDVLMGHHDEAVRSPGGSPANVAVGLARFEHPATLVCHLARDADGLAIAGWLESAGVALDPASWSAASTPVATVALGEDGKPEYAFDVTFSLPDSVALPQGLAALHVGSYSAFMRPGAAAVLSLVREARRAGVQVSVDPNVREDLVGPREDALAQFEALAELADVVKLSDEDHAWLYPGRDEAEVRQRLHALGVRIVAVTRGGAGATLSASGRVVDVRAKPVVVADSVGAGDSFMSALIHQALLGGADHPWTEPQLRAAGEFCVTAAAITVSRVGANPPTRAEVLAVG
jgi:fructokinase